MAAHIMCARCTCSAVLTGEFFQCAYEIKTMTNAFEVYFSYLLALMALSCYFRMPCLSQKQTMLSCVFI